MKQQIEIIQIQQGEDMVLKNLLQLYQYDWSEISGKGVVDENGQYHHIDLEKFWTYPGSKAFVIKVEKEVAGFVMTRYYSHLTHTEDTFFIEEFFVMRKFRKQGVGGYVAQHIFDLYRGRWEIMEPHINPAAREFWRQVVGNYTHEKYQEVTAQDEKGPVWLQTFRND